MHRLCKFRFSTHTRARAQPIQCVYLYISRVSQNVTQVITFAYYNILYSFTCMSARARIRYVLLCSRAAVATVLKQGVLGGLRSRRKRLERVLGGKKKKNKNYNKNFTYARAKKDKDVLWFIQLFSIVNPYRYCLYDIVIRYSAVVCIHNIIHKYYIKTSLFYLFFLVQTHIFTRPRVQYAGNVILVLSPRVPCYTHIGIYA